MTSQSRRRLWQLRSLKIGLLLVFVVTSVIAVVGLGREVRKELHSLGTGTFDNVQWNLSSLEVDLLAFQTAAMRVSAAHAGYSEMDYDPPPSLQQLRLLFDALYTRIGTIAQGAGYAELRAQPRAAANLDRIKNFLNATVARIDGSDAELYRNLNQIVMAADHLRPVVRSLAVDSISMLARHDTEQRQYLSLLLLKMSLLGAAIFTALSVALLVLRRQIGITAEQNRQRAQSNLRLRAMIGASLDAILVADHDGRIIEANEPSAKIFGCSRGDLVGRTLHQLIIPEKYSESSNRGSGDFGLPGDQAIVDVGLLQLSARRVDGSGLPVEVSIATAQGPEGKIFVAYLRDITKRLKIKRDLMEARDKALAADEAKSNFLAVMSHEMRTPLNGMMGTLELLAATELDERQRQFVEMAEISGGLLLRHINDVLDITKSEARELVMSEDVFAPAEVVHRVVELNRILAEARGNRINIENCMPEDLVIRGDRFRLGQILFNLLGNAVKFTSGGRITVTLAEGPMADGERTIEFRVADTGIGIAEQDQARIFEDFVTIDVSYCRGAGGTGMGLGICRRMARAMDGDVFVRSKLGHGSTFWLSIPLRAVSKPAVAGAAEAEDSAPAADNVPPGLSVLLVEDNEINRLVARETLRSLGAGVAEAENGAEGLARARTERFDLILMDVSMPRMDGVEATEKIRASGGKSARSPIVGLTAHALPEEQMRFADAGMQACLVKPVNREKMAELLRQVPQLNAASSPPPLASVRNDTVVDDAQIAELRSTLGPPDFETALEKFRGEVETALASIQRPTDVDAARRTAAMVHRISGAAGTFGTTRLRQQLLAIETACKRGEFDGIEPSLAAARETWKETLAAIEGGGRH